MQLTQKQVTNPEFIARRLCTAIEQGLLGGGKHPDKQASPVPLTRRLLQLVSEWKLLHTSVESFLADLERFPLNHLLQPLSLSLQVFDLLAVERQPRTNWRLFVLARKLLFVELERNVTVTSLRPQLVQARAVADNTENYPLLAEVIILEKLLKRDLTVWHNETGKHEHTPLIKITDEIQEAKFLLRCDQLFVIERNQVEHKVRQYLELNLHKTWRTACSLIYCISELIQRGIIQPELVKDQLAIAMKTKRLKDSWRVRSTAENVLQALEGAAASRGLQSAFLVPERFALLSGPLVKQVVGETRLLVRPENAVPELVADLVWGLAASYECVVWIDGRAKEEFVWAEVAARLGITAKNYHIVQTIVQGYLICKRSLIVLDQPHRIPDLPDTASILLISDSKIGQGYTKISPLYKPAVVVPRLTHLLEQSPLAQNLTTAYVLATQQGDLHKYVEDVLSEYQVAGRDIMTAVVRVSVRALKLPESRVLLELLAVLNVPNVPEELYAPALASLRPELKAPWQIRLAKDTLQLFKLVGVSSSLHVSIHPEVASVVSHSISSSTLLVNAWLQGLEAVVNSRNPSVDSQLVHAMTHIIERYQDQVHRPILYKFALLCHETTKIPLTFSVKKAVQWAKSLENRQAETYLTQLGNYCTYTQAFPEAIQCREQCIIISIEANGLENSKTVRAIQELARTQAAQHKHKAAVDSYSRALATQYALGLETSLGTAELLFELGQVHRKDCAFSQAVEAQTEAHRIRQEALGPSHLLTANTLVELGKCWIALEVYPRAASCFEQALTCDQATAAACTGLGQVSQARGECQAALAFLRRAFARVTSDYGKYHPALCDLLDSLAEVHFSLRSSELADECFSSALSLKQRLYGSSDQRVLSSVYGKAYAYERSGQLTSAVKQYKRALRLESILELNPARTLTKLIKLSKALGLLQKALEYSNQAVNCSNKQQLVKALQHLAGIQRSMGLGAEAKATCEQAIDLTSRLHKSKETLNIKSYALLGCLHQDTGETELARQFFAYATEMHPSTRSSDVMLYAGLAQAGLGNYQEAIKLYQRALDLLTAKQCTNTPEASTLACLSAMAYSELNQFAYAKTAYKQALTVLTFCFGESSLQLVNPLNNLGSIHFALHQYEKALKYYLKTLAIEQQAGEKERTADTLCNIGLVYNQLDNNDAALEYYQQALGLQIRHQNQVKIATTLNNIGVIKVSLGAFDEALEALEAALQKKKDMYGSVHLETATTLHTLGTCCSKQGNAKAALDHFNGALAIRSKELGPTHPSTLATAQKISQVYHLS